MKQACAVCNKEFDAKPADVRRGWAKTCSKSCAATLRNRKTGFRFKPELSRGFPQPEDDLPEIGHPFQSGYFGHGQE